MQIKPTLDAILEHPDFRQGDCWQEAAYPANHTIFSEGELSKTIYFIVEGQCRAVGHVDIGKDKQVNPGVYELKEGDIFGELAVFDELPRSTSVLSLDSVRLIEIDGDKLTDFLQKHPSLGYAIMNALVVMLVKRLRASNKKIFSLFAWGLKAHSIDDHL
ncbi:MAG: cyclic nucleotide-binding domain-containing protein [Gammaproteobacteria bacterium]|nr:cyclic nucleotide-binding domain-containing protein [Gammaproteobacteria bacterium]